MKSKFIFPIFLFLMITAHTEVFGQSFLDKIKKVIAPLAEEKSIIQEAPQLELREIISLKIDELLKLGNSFKYGEELLNGKYIVESDNAKVYLKILKPGVRKFSENSSVAQFAILSKNISEILTFKIIRINNYCNLQLENSERYINEKEFLQNISKLTFDNPSPIQHIFKDRIIIDKEICNFTLLNPNLPNKGKILNRSVARDISQDPNHREGEVFADVTAGTIIPLPLGAGSPKLLVVDKLWDRIILMDRDIENGESTLAYDFPLYPGYYYSLFQPTDIVPGARRTYSYSTFIDSIVSLYVADQGNNRIVRLEYVMQYTDDEYGIRYHQSYIRDASFRVLLHSTQPYGLAIHKGINLSDSTDDVLWYTEGHIGQKGLVCVNAITGQFIQYVNNLRNTRINPSRVSIYRSPDGLRNVLSFIDEESNQLGVLKLEPNGTFVNAPLNVRYLENFGIIKLKSVALSSYNNGSNETAIWVAGDGGSGFCYGGTHCGDVSTLKISYLNNFPATVEYLATSWKGYNSPSSFVNLQNIHPENGYLDIVTFEKWTDLFGLRKYKPGVDIISHSISEYCYPAEYCTYTVRLTNPAKVKFTGQYKPANGQWQSYPISVNGQGPDPILSLQAGTNSLRVCRTSSGSSPIDREELKVIAEYIPFDESSFTNNNHKLTLEKVSTFTNCSVSGGCPFAYVYDGNNFVQDNNILHRSEFDGNLGVDIEDKYLLRVNPYLNTSDSTYSIRIKELNNDLSSFDKFCLVAVDHPEGTKLGVTENNDYTLYFPTITNSLDYAEHEGVDVTSELQYDTNYSKNVCGEEDDNVIGTFDASGSDELKKSMKRNLMNRIKNIPGVHNLKNNNSRKSNIKIKGDSWMQDSIAILIDPGICDAIIQPPAKKPAGTITGYDASNEYVSPEIEFAQRQNSSPVLVVVGGEVNIDSVVSVWSSSFSITFLSVSPVFFGGYIENNLELIEAIDSLNGNVLSSLTDVDQNYATMDSTTNITLRFKNTFGEVQSGFVRDYVLVTTGRYENVNGGDNFMLNGSENNIVPKSYKLHQNYPNPFNPNTTIKFELPKEGLVTIKVYDILGKEVYSLGEMKQPGVHQLIFNGGNFASGIYFYRIESGSFVRTRRMVLLK